MAPERYLDYASKARWQYAKILVMRECGEGHRTMQALGMYVAPELGKPGFHCPICGVSAQHAWYNIFIGPPSTPDVPAFALERFRARQRAAATAMNPTSWGASPQSVAESDPLQITELQPKDPSAMIFISAIVGAAKVSLCGHCRGRLVWIDDRIVWPPVGGAPPANSDMPDEVRADYQEAASIVYLSPRGAAALLRLAIQKLCKYLGEPGKNINVDIGSLVANGLDAHIQEALDAVRVIGNESVHPGEMNLKDDQETAVALFGLVNLIVEEMISRKKRIRAVYSKLPPDKLKGIMDRDAKSKSPPPTT